MAKITFEDKVALDEQAAIADVNKVRASDMNQIKSVVNGLDDTISNLGTTLSSSYLPLTGGILSGDLAFSHTDASKDGHISWTQGTYQQRIKIVDNSGSTANTFVFQKSADSGSNWTNLLTIANDGKITATTFVGALSGNATTATTASKADRLTTGRTLTIGNTGKEFAGNANVSWSLSEIGAAAASHSHNVISNRGVTTPDTGTTVPGYGGLSMVSAYNNGYPYTYGNVLRLYGGGFNELLMCWNGSGGHADVYQRSKRDVASTAWSEWYTMLDSANYSNWANKSFVQSSQPTAKAVGDIWFS